MDIDLNELYEKLDNIDHNLKKIRRKERIKSIDYNNLTDNIIPDYYIIRSLIESIDDNDVIFWLWKNIYIKEKNHRWNNEHGYIEFYYRGKWLKDKNDNIIKIVISNLEKIVMNVLPEDPIIHYKNHGSTWIRILNRIYFIKTEEYLNNFKLKISSYLKHNEFTDDLSDE